MGIVSAIRGFGLREYLRQVLRYGQFRGGVQVGTDELGNRYYEVKDPEYMQACKSTNSEL